MRPVIEAPAQRIQAASWQILLTSGLVVGIASMDLSLFGTAIAIEAGETSSAVFLQLIWIVAVTSVPIAYLILPALTRANRSGRKKVASRGMWLFVIGSVIAAVAPTFDVVIFGRLLQVGIAFGIAGTLAFAASRTGITRRSLLTSWAGASAMGFVAGPLVAGGGLQFGSWPVLFWVEAALGLIALVCVRKFLVQGRANDRPPRGDVLGGIILGVGIWLFSWGFLALTSELEFDRVQQQTFSSPAGWILMGGGAAIFVAGAIRVRAKRQTRQQLAIDRSTQLAVVALGVGLATGLTTNALFLAGVQQRSPAATAILLLPFLAASTLAFLMVRALLNPRHYRIAIVIGAVFWVVALGFSFQLTRSAELDHLAWSLSLVLQGVGAGFLLAVTNDSQTLSTRAQALEDGPMIRIIGIYAARQLGIAVGLVSLGVLLVGEAVRDAEVVERGWFLAALAGLSASMLWLRRSRVADTPLVSSESTLEERQPAYEGSSRGQVRRRPTAALLEFLRQRDLDPLATLPLFADLSHAQREHIEKNSHEVTVSAGEQIFASGERSDSMYVIRSGRVSIKKGGVSIRRLGRGDVFGESEVLDGSKRQTDAVATRDALLMRIDRSSILAIEDASFFRAMAVSLSHRLAEVAPRITEGNSQSAEAVISVLSADEHAPVADIARALEGLLGRHRTVIVPGRVDRLALERAESLGDVVLLVDDPTDPDWSQFCRRVADRTISVTTRAQPSPTIPLGAHVVIVDAQPTQEQFTEWCESVHYSSRTLVRMDHLVEDLQPLSDRLVSRSLGLAMGGGGAKGLAHIGVMDVLTEAGIRVDRIAGTSMGALVGACFACGLSPDSVDAIAFDVMVRKNPVSDYTFPRHSLVRGKRLDQSVERIFGQTRIEALPIPFACISVDLITRQQVVHRFGPLGDAVAASSRLPGILPPYPHSLGGLHIDGGLLNNLPVDALDRHEGPIVAVQVGGRASLTEEDAAAEPFSFGETILRSMMMASDDANVAATNAADVLIQPDTSSASLTEFHRLDAMREAGQIAAEAALPDIKRLLQIP